MAALAGGHASRSTSSKPASEVTLLYSSFCSLHNPINPYKNIMDVSFAITGKGYVILAADTTAAHSIIKVKLDEDKIKQLSPHLLMAYSGEPGAFFSLLTIVTVCSYRRRRYRSIC